VETRKAARFGFGIVVVVSMNGKARRWCPRLAKVELLVQVDSVRGQSTGHGHGQEQHKELPRTGLSGEVGILTNLTPIGIFKVTLKIDLTVLVEVVLDQGLDIRANGIFVGCLVAGLSFGEEEEKRDCIA